MHTAHSINRACSYRMWRLPTHMSHIDRSGSACRLPRPWCQTVADPVGLYHSVHSQLHLSIRHRLLSSQLPVVCHLQRLPPHLHHASVATVTV